LGLAFLKESISKIGTDQERGTILLDCWAGNEKLRAFYEKSGFKLLGEFPENDYEIAVFYYEMFKVS
jgi:RimJ/RimL family protein N-acetyltransferase